MLLDRFFSRIHLPSNVMLTRTNLMRCSIPFRTILSSYCTPTFHWLMPQFLAKFSSLTAKRWITRTVVPHLIVRQCKIGLMEKLPHMIEISIDTILGNGIILPASLDTIEAAVLVYLQDRFGEKAQNFLGQPPPARGLIIYALQDEGSWTHLGTLGELWLRSLGPQRSNLRAIPPKQPNRQDALLYGFDWSVKVDDPKARLALAESNLWQVATKKLTEADPSFDSWFHRQEIEVTGEKIILEYQEQLHQSRLKFLRNILNELMACLQRDGLLGQEMDETGVDRRSTSENTPPGNPGLATDELTRRLALALWAQEIRLKDPSLPWKEISRKIRWTYSVKLLEDARHRLVRAQKSNDPILEEAERLKEKLQRNSG